MSKLDIILGEHTGNGGLQWGKDKVLKQQIKDLMLDLMQNVHGYENPSEPGQIWLNEAELRQKIEEL